MASYPHHPDRTRQAVEQSVLVEGMTVLEAAQAHGVPPSTVRRWIKGPVPTRGPDPAAWSAARRAAAGRVYDNPTVALGDWALLLGWPRTGVARLAKLCRLPAADAAATDRGPALPVRPGWEAVELGRRLRRHLARRIASLDAELASARAGADTAKVLRDLGGLKRLVDELGEAGGSDERTPRDRRSGANVDPGSSPGSPPGSPPGSSPGSSPDAQPLDLAALRATLAARIAAFEEGGPA